MKATDNFFLIAGPCVIEGRNITRQIAATVAEIADKYSIPYVFKASYRKANRSRVDSFTGIGDEAGLEILQSIKEDFKLPILTDIHNPSEAALAASYGVDILQIPAFLCRQTDLLVAAAKTGKIVNIKKGQFLSGLDMRHPYLKAMESGAKEVWLTERGNTFGYNNMIVDFRNIAEMRRFAPTVIMDCTHSVQRPGGGEGCSSGNREFIPAMAEAAKAFGCDGYFFEVHPTPEEALCDGDNSLHINDLENTITKLL